MLTDGLDAVDLQMAVVDGMTLDGIGSAGDPFKIADAGVGTVQIADEVVTEPKLDAVDTPASGEVLSWDGTQFMWVADSMGGSGDITSVTTASTSGLSGGSDSGDVALLIATNGGHRAKACRQ